VASGSAATRPFLRGQCLRRLENAPFGDIQRIFIEILCGEFAKNNNRMQDESLGSFVLHVFAKSTCRKKVMPNCSIPGDGGWNARSCDGAFPGFRRLRRRTAT
jgi:hypothetical protein